jgi:hypothetical protein
MKVPSLSELQANFTRAIRDLVPDLQSLALKPPSKQKPGERLEIYSYAINERFKSSIAEDFSETKQVIGEKVFDKIATEFVSKVASPYWNLAEYSGLFPKFLENHSILAAYPFLADLAQLEWEKILTSFGCAPEILDVNELTNKSDEDWADAHLVLNQTLRVIDADWNLYDVDKLNRDSKPHSVRLLLFRDREGIAIHLCEPLESEIIDGIQSGRSMFELSDVLARKGHDPALIENWFASAITSQLLTSVLFP